MPYAFERRKVNLLPHADKRVKLSADDETQIRRLYAEGATIRSIAREYQDKCSRRLVQFVLFPERREHCADLFRLRRLDGRYYERKQHREYMKTYRRRKQKILERGKMTNRGLIGRRVTVGTQGRMAGTVDQITSRGIVVRHTADGEKRWWPREAIKFVHGDYTGKAK